MNRRPTRRAHRLSRFFAGAVFVAPMPVIPARAANLAVPGDSNLYGAGHATPPAPAGFGTGSLPPVFSFPAGPGQTLAFSDVTGCVALTVSFGDCNGPDGSTTHVLPTNIDPYGGLSGIAGDTNGFLAGVFLDDTEPVDPAPAALDFRGGALGTAFTDLSPVIGQLFFIGDGRTGTGAGAVQTFQVPPTATRLFLGYADGYAYTGPPGAYGDNGGAFSATFTITGTLPPPGEPTLFKVARVAGDLVFDWIPPGPTCGALQYALYKGDFRSLRVSGYSHATALKCTLAGSPVAFPETDPRFGAADYYLIVSSNGPEEGSYGRNWKGIERPVSAAACAAAQNLSACP